jgi:hypothetical protein
VSASEGEPGVLARVLTTLPRSANTFTPGAVIGAGSYFHDGNVRQALLIYLLAPPAVVASQVLCKWIRLLEPPRRWRRPRRRGG